MPALLSRSTYLKDTPVKLTLSRDELTRALFRVQGIVERRPVVPINGHALLEAKNGRLHVSATDGEVSLSGSQPAEVATKGALAVGARQLYEIVRSLPAGEVALQTRGKGLLELKTGASEFRLATLAADQFPALPSAKAVEDWQMDAGLLLRMVERTLFCVSQDDSRVSLSGVYFEPQGGGALRLVATDGHRLALAEGTLGAAGEPRPGFIVPRKGLTELRRMLGERTEDRSVSLGMLQHAVVFACDGVVLTSKLVEGQFPDYKQVVPEGGDKRAVLERGALTDALKRVSLLSQAKSHGVRMVFGDGQLVLEAEDPDMGDAREALPVAYEGEKLTVGFNARYLLEALALMDRGQVQVQLADDMSPAVLTPHEATGYTAVVMPMRV